MTDPVAVIAAVAIALGLIALVATYHQLVFSGKSLLVFFVLLLMFVPIRRYAFPSSLPIHLEPYRVVIVVLAGGALFSLLVDPRWRWRSMAFGWLAALFLGTSLLSIAVNFSSITGKNLATEVLQSFLVQLSWFAAWVIFRLLLTSPSRVLLVLRTITTCGAILALTAVYEARRKQNLFDLVLTHVSILHEVKSEKIEIRQGAYRAVASAQHSIPLGMLFVMLFPVAMWLMFRDGQGKRGRQTWWLLCGGLEVLGAAATISRVAMIALVLEVVTCLILRPKALKFLLPFALAGLLVVHFAVPGLEGKIVKAFFPSQGIAAQQSTGAGTSAAGRLYKAKAVLHDISHHPITGDGFGTRIVQGPKQNTLLLDDAYLDQLQETGVLGLSSLLLLAIVPLILLTRRARRDQTPWGDLAAALAIMMPGIAVSWLLYDAMAYGQEVIVLFLLFAVGAWVLNEVPEPVAEQVAVPPPEFAVLG